MFNNIHIKNTINKYNKSLFIMIYYMFFILLNACTSQETCLEGDDFGYSIYTISATSKNIKNIGNYQYIDWTDTGINIKKGPIQFIVKPSREQNGIESNGQNLGPINYSNVWAPWFCNGTSSVSNCVNKHGIPASLFQRTCNLVPTNVEVNTTIADEICNIIDNNGAKISISDTCNSSNNQQSNFNSSKPPKTESFPALKTTTGSAPCLMGDGVGLYALIVPATDLSSPNESVVKNIAASLQVAPPNPTSKTNNAQKWLTFHLGYDVLNLETNKQIYAGQHVGGISIHDGLPDYEGGRLYFKILDSYYGDNIGGYNIVIRSGAGDEAPGPIQYVINIVSDVMFNSAYVLYMGIISEPNFSLIVNTSLILFIIFYAICFTLGITDFTQKELLIRVVKLSIVASMLSSSTAEYFYNNYLSAIFHDGLDNLVCLVTNQDGNSCMRKGSHNIATNDYLAILDKPWKMIFSKAIFIKLSGFSMSVLLFAYILGYLSLILIALSALQVGIFFTTCIAMIAFLISFSPIYITFLLFNKTRPLFDAWLRVLSSNFLQAIIVIGGFHFLYTLYYDFFYKLLGSRVCTKSYEFLGVKVFSFWDNSCSGSNEIIGKVQLPFESLASNLINNNECGKLPGKVIPAFKTILNRNINLPSVDICLDDTIYIAITGNETGKQILLFFLLVIIAWIVFNCVQMFPKISAIISNTSYSYANPENIANRIYDLSSRPIYALRSKAYDTLKSLKNEASKQFSKKMDEYRNDPESEFGNVLRLKDAVGDKFEKKIGKKAREKISQLHPGTIAGKAYRLAKTNPITKFHAKNAEFFQNGATIQKVTSKVSSMYSKYGRNILNAENEILRKIPVLNRFTDNQREDYTKELNTKILKKRKELQEKARNDPTINDKLDKYDDYIKKSFGIDVKRDLLK
jgi:type IV secretory pathway VirB6-like protein